MALLGVCIIGEQSKFKRNVCRKPTFGSLHTHFCSFLANTYKIGMIYTLLIDTFRYALTGQCFIRHSHS